MKKEKVFSLFYIVPIVAITLFLFIFPLLYSLYISFTNLSLLHFL
ncbi:sugar ABC transporter permease, partial [Sulfolobus sp. E1]